MRLQWIPLLFTVGLYSLIASATNTDDENVSIIIAEAVQGSIGRLPCNVTPPMIEDKVVLVIWYKQNYSTPIYSFDTRGAKFEKGSHWVDEKSLAGRAYFEAAALPAELKIESIINADSGIYRCRVDFYKSPTRNSKVQLKVILPPERLLILDEKGQQIPHYILGPYNENASVNITCVSAGGRPLPHVTWWHENTLLDDTSVILSEKRVRNILHLEKLQRSHLHMVLTCQASNNNITEPISSSVTLDMNLRPLWIKLLGENRPLSAESPYSLSCEVVGSRPAPYITWWKGSLAMRNTTEIFHPDGNTTTSILTFTPTIDDRGKFLSCRAEQSSIPDSGIENGWKLDIYHIPVVTLEFGINLNTSSIREGADVYFECNIKSNPWVYRVSWRHNGKLLDNNIPEGINVANQSLVLQNVSRARSGLYTCVGSNSEGDGESNPVQLDIKFTPFCRPGQQNMYSIGRQETIKIACELEANPTDITFTWKFNTSNTETLDIPINQINNDRARSVVEYSPMTAHDYGTLLCWGSNDFGAQTEPCVFTIIPAGIPDPLVNCTVYNQTSNTFQIECIEGFDGGLQQKFIIEIFAVHPPHQFITRLESTTPYFEIRDLDAGSAYQAVLASVNKKGRSALTNIRVFTLKNPEKQTDLYPEYTPAIENIKPFLGSLLGIVGGLVFIATIIVFIVRKRGSSGRDRNCSSVQTVNDATLRGQQTYEVAGQDLCSDSVESIEKNPDVVPHGTKTDEREEDEKAFEWINKTHPNIYATAALAEQNGVNTTQYDRISYTMNDKMCMQQQQQQQLQQQHTQQQQYPIGNHQNYYTTLTMPPPTSIGYNQSDKMIALTYADMSHPMVQQRPPQFSSATLGRPRPSDIKRTDPLIFAQIDLAHHTMYPTSNAVYGTNTIVTKSHPSQMTTFPPPPLFANNPVNHPLNPPVCSSNANTLLQVVPEEKISITAETTDHIQSIPDRTQNNSTRF